MSREFWLVRCDCLDDDGRPLRRLETCNDCADDTAALHASLGHHPTVGPNVRLEGSEGYSRATQRLTQRRGGW